MLKLPFYDFFKALWDYSDFTTENYWVCVLLAFLVLALAVVICILIYLGIYDIIDSRKSTTQIINAALIDKKYIGEQTSSGTGTAVIPNSTGGIGIGVVSSSSHSDEQFLFFGKDNDQIYKVPVSMQQYYNYSIGDKIKIELKFGGLSNDVLDTKLLHQ